MLDSETLCRRAVKILKKKKLRRIPNGEANVKNDCRTCYFCACTPLINLNTCPFGGDRKTAEPPLDLEKITLEGGLASFRGRLASGRPVFVHFPGMESSSVVESLLIHKARGSLSTRAPHCRVAQRKMAWHPHSCVPFFLYLSLSLSRYNITTGLYPFEGDNIYKLFENIGKGDYTIPEDCGPPLSDLLRGMLEYDPAKRFSIQQIRHHNTTTTDSWNFLLSDADLSYFCSRFDGAQWVLQPLPTPVPAQPPLLLQPPMTLSTLDLNDSSRPRVKAEQEGQGQAGLREEECTVEEEDGLLAFLFGDSEAEICSQEGRKVALSLGGGQRDQQEEEEEDEENTAGSLSAQNV
ncbi:hypothetical protein JRQ81_009034 [Phrynocephalus forsythii]|uniref:non-specific serine/threonine protein kinase n=1 Tax=Phrynocephalus forsythii TaxID=171643 RepID=A0A9Q1ASU2_9SAUR|nr:hypothetical protein JRQ81_009034 [Phrynocephalus forsythii]